MQTTLNQSAASPLQTIRFYTEEIMKTQFAAALAALSHALAPAAAYSADKKDPADKSAAPSKVDKAVEKTREVVDDATITTKIKAEYAKDKTVSALKIHVNTDKGVVRLSGEAKSKDEAAKAVEIAKSVHGVTAVKNEITVGASGTKK
jgi:osmotically-inducible protein OsmY